MYDENVMGFVFFLFQGRVVYIRRRCGNVAVAATIGIVTPSLIIILLVASVLRNYVDNEYVVHAFAGIRVVVVALILDAVVRLWKQGVVGRFGWAMFAVCLLLLILGGFSPVMIVIFAGVAGYLYQFWLRRKRQ